MAISLPQINPLAVGDGNGVTFAQVFNPIEITLAPQAIKIIDGSISNFQQTPIEKCFNEFTLKFHKFLSDFKLMFGIYHVDENAFPEYYDVENPVFGTPMDVGSPGLSYDMGYDDATDTWSMSLFFDDASDIIDSFDADPYSLRYVTTEEGFNFIFHSVVLAGESSLGKAYTFTRNDEVPPTPSVTTNYKMLTIADMDTQNSPPTWKTFVSTKEYDGTSWNYVTEGGIDYTTAKDLWEIAHNAYLINRRIRKAPTDRTDLEYAIDLNTFNGEGNINIDGEYAIEYLKLLVSWTNRQKFTVNFNVPLTKDTLAIELLDVIMFSDVLLLPSGGKGWVTSKTVLPAKSQIKIGITFEPNLFSPAPNIPCNNYIETGSAGIDIIETGSQPDNIIEPCNN